MLLSRAMLTVVAVLSWLMAVVIGARVKDVASFLFPINATRPVVTSVAASCGTLFWSISRLTPSVASSLPDTLNDGLK